MPMSPRRRILVTSALALREWTNTSWSLSRVHPDRYLCAIPETARAPRHLPVRR